MAPLYRQRCRRRGALFYVSLSIVIPDLNSTVKRSEFCEHFGIPVRSLHNWEIVDRKTAPFLLFLVCRVYDLEQENGQLQECIDEVKLYSWMR